jgi:hypothetical protein
MNRFVSLTAAALAGAVVFAGAPAAQAAVPSIPTVEGPITGPGPMHPGMRDGPAGTNPVDFGYRVDEYFVSGTANGAPYKVRMLIRRPEQLSKFSGIVVYEPTHRGGNALIFQFARYGIVQRGHAGITVGARAINLINASTPQAGLKTYNPDRYGSLQVVDSQTNEILAQVAYMLKTNNAASPMAAAGFNVSGIVMGGTSDSSAATRSYMANAHNTAWRTPAGGPIIDGFFVSSILGTAKIELVDVPRIAMPTEFEVFSSRTQLATNGGMGAYRGPDSNVPGNQLRIYEIAGMSHNDARDQPAAAVFPGCGEPLSRFPHGAMNFMGLQWVIDWAFNGKTPPASPAFVNLAGSPTAIVTDAYGNATGGVRTPHIDVSLYHYALPNTGPGLCSQSARQEILPNSILNTLYPTQAKYVSLFTKRLNELTAAGFWPKEYTTLYAIQDMKAFTNR